MDIVQRLLALGIKPDGPADILLNSRKQFQLIKDFGIDLQADKDNQYRCMIAPNTGNQVFNSPVVGHSAGSATTGMSLQVGIFTLLNFKRLLPLLPVFKDPQASRLTLGLYRVDDQLFDLPALVRLYKVDQVFEDFRKMQSDHRSTQSIFLQEYEAKKAMQRKVARQQSNLESDTREPGILMEEVVDEDLITQISSTLELQKAQYEENLNIDPWSRSKSKQKSETPS